MAGALSKSISRNKITPDRANIFDGLSFEGLDRRRPDLGRPGNNMRVQKMLSDPQRLENRVVKDRPSIIPGTKMFFSRDMGRDLKSVKESIVRTFDALMDRYGSDYTLEVPRMDLSYPPYDSRWVEVGRFIALCFFKRCARGKGGSANQKIGVFHSNGNQATTIEQFRESVEREYHEYQKQFKHSEYEAGARGTFFQMPWQEKPDYIHKEDRYSQFSLFWIDNWKKRENPLKEEENNDVARELKVFHHATTSPFPTTYEQSRDPKHRNCVVEFQNAINKKLDQLRAEGYKVTHFDISIKPGLVVQSNDGSSGVPQNNIFAFIRVEKNRNNLLDGQPVKLEPRKQIRFVADTRSYTEVLPNLKTQEYLASPLNRLASEAKRDLFDLTDPNNPDPLAYKDPNNPNSDIRNWNAGVITFGNFNPSMAAAKTGRNMGPSYRLVHSVLLTEPTPEDKPADTTALKDMVFMSRILRGGHGENDYSRSKSPGKKEQFQYLFDDKIRQLQMEKYEKTGEWATFDAVKSELESDKSNLSIVFREIDREIKRRKKLEMSDLNQYKYGRSVHDVEWSLEGGILESLSRITGLIKGIVQYRNYLGFNFPGGEQGFHNIFYIWYDKTKLNPALVEA